MLVRINRLLNKNYNGEYTPDLEYYVVDEEDGILVDELGIPVASVE
jgi:hypothetical protein